MKTDMCKIARDFNVEDTEAIAKFYSSKEFVPAKQTVDADLADPEY